MYILGLSLLIQFAVLLMRQSDFGILIRTQLSLPYGIAIGKLRNDVSA